FYISYIGTLDNLIVRLANGSKDIYIQGRDGPITHGKQISPLYRGKYYKKAVQHYAKLISRIQPTFVAQDVEHFPRKISTYKQSPIYQKEFKAAGYNSWDKFLFHVGNTWWHGFINASTVALQKEGVHSPLNRGIFALHLSKSLDPIQSFNDLYSNKY